MIYLLHYTIFKLKLKWNKEILRNDMNERTSNYIESLYSLPAWRTEFPLYILSPVRCSPAIL